MRAIGYLLAGAAVFSGLAFGLDPAANANLPNGWRYKGCYSDKPYNYLAFSDPPSPSYGVPAQPRTLNGYYIKMTPNGGLLCVNKCVSLGFKYAATNDDQCWCDNAIAANGTNTGLFVSWGVPDANNNNCQTGCRGNLGEACGFSPLVGTNSQRLSLYEYIVSGVLFLLNVCVLGPKHLNECIRSFSRNTNRDYDKRTNERNIEEGYEKAIERNFCHFCDKLIKFDGAESWSEDVETIKFLQGRLVFTRVIVSGIAYQLISIEFDSDLFFQIQTFSTTKLPILTCFFGSNCSISAKMRAFDFNGCGPEHYLIRRE
ncbi:hypothetical protein BKA66DRAFT_545889 [Pyrenochaeta sp. MPI-SDFR-AT-0127]|nr:hypothetical protein BKA66DRAFT_545889 [Pyrenochaeta sp. MPI-SDFR-AT-0127]